MIFRDLDKEEDTALADEKSDCDEDLGVGSPAPSQSTLSQSKLAPEQQHVPDGKLPWLLGGVVDCMYGITSD